MSFSAGHRDVITFERNNSAKFCRRSYIFLFFFCPVTLSDARNDFRSRRSYGIVRFCYWNLYDMQINYVQLVFIETNTSLRRSFSTRHVGTSLRFRSVRSYCAHCRTFASSHVIRREKRGLPIDSIPRAQSLADPYCLLCVYVTG